MSQTVGRTRNAYNRLWHHTSLSSPSTPPLGRLASRIAVLLMGKHKPIYDPSTDCGDYVVATDCADLFVTGKKMQKKKYYSHTTRPGSLKEINMLGMVRKWGGGEVLKRAVRGMLPKNRLRDVRLGRLKVFEGSAHPFKENLIHIDGRRIPSDPVVKAQIDSPVGEAVAANKVGQTASDPLVNSV